MAKKKRPRPTPSPADLQAMSQHIAYEWDMLVGTAKLLMESWQGGTLEDNARLESFLIHARQIYQFFFSEPRMPTDIVVSDYLPNWRAAHPPASAPPELKQVSKAVGEHVAHLTLHRLVTAHHPVPVITHQCVALIKSFRVAVAPGLFPAQPTLSLDGPWTATPSPPAVTTSTTSSLGTTYRSS